MALPTIDNYFTLTGDPEMRFSPTGAGVCSFNVAANKPKRENGQIVKDERGYPVNDKTLYLNCVAFGQLGEMIAEQAGSGSSVRLVGDLETQQWADKNTGEKRSKVQLVVDFARVIPRRNQGQGGNQGGGFSQGGYSGQEHAPQGGWGQNPNSDPWANSNGPAQGGFSDQPPF
jgi:single-strand DNA-binding protein